ncbi:MAG: restriction endonuclease [Anaerolineae bacterium]|nr:restriction endonuclease [Anaerolineae bacterium]
MIVAGVFSFNGGREALEARYAAELAEVYEVIAAVDAEQHRVKFSEEKTMPGRLLYSPPALNDAYIREFTGQGWASHRIACDYPTDYYTADYTPQRPMRGAYREMDFVKNRVGVEVQFGKYAFMVYNVAAKMTIFRNQGVIDVGVEIVPINDLAKGMSTGVSYFEQFVWDLTQRGVADIDIPVLILGVAAASSGSG